MDMKVFEIEDSFFSAQELVNVAKKRIEEVANKDSLSGIASGFEKLDKLTSGWQPADLIVIAGRPSMGKTAFALSMIRNMSVDFGISVALFSPEMSSSQIISRFITIETGLSSDKLRTGKLEKHEWEQLSVKSKNLEKSPIQIDDTANISVERLADSARNAVIENGVRIIVIDNIHLMSSGNIEKGNFTREQELSTIMRRLKALAKELHIPIIVISQLSRGNEHRYSNRPSLNDLRGSGTIEEIADIVAFLYRPEYYNIDEWDDEEQLPTQGEAEIIVSKHRTGSLDNIRLKFLQYLGKFDNLDNYSGAYDGLPKKMTHEDNPFVTKNLPSPNEAFGSNLNNSNDDSDVPF